VPVTSGELVTHLEFALDGDEYLHHLDHARRKLITFFQPLNLLLHERALAVDELTRSHDDLVHLLLLRLVSDLNVPEIFERHRLEKLGSERRTFRDELVAFLVNETRRGHLPLEKIGNTLESRIPNDLHLVTVILLD